jgi:hypothetical protein
MRVLFVSIVGFSLYREHWHWRTESAFYSVSAGLLLLVVAAAAGGCLLWVAFMCIHIALKELCYCPFVFVRSLCYG